MSFELIVPRLRADCVGPGQCSLNATGLLLFHGADLRAVGINGHAALLVDRATGRVAIRAPKPDEPAMKVRHNKSKTSGGVAAAQAVSALGVDADKAKGRHNLSRKDDLLIVQFTPPSSAAGLQVATPRRGRPPKSATAA